RLAELFAGKSQLIVYHFMMTPGSNHRCEGCSFLADHIDGADQHLKHHDVSLVVVSRAPLAELLPYRQRMGWKFDWVSSYASDFNFNMQVSSPTSRSPPAIPPTISRPVPGHRRSFPAPVFSTGTRPATSSSPSCRAP